MGLNSNVFNRIEAEKTPTMEPNDPTSLTQVKRNTAKINNIFGGKDMLSM